MNIFRNPTSLDDIQDFKPFGCNYKVDTRLLLELISQLIFAGSSSEVRQAQGVQPLAQVWCEVHEDLPAVSHHLPLDRQDGGRQQSRGPALSSDIINTLSDCTRKIVYFSLKNHLLFVVPISLYSLETIKRSCEQNSPKAIICNSGHFS